MGVILYGILLAHLYSYKEQYTNVGITFAITYLMKRLIKSTSKDHADMIGLGGYSLTMKEFVKLLGQIKTSGFQGNDKMPSQEFIGGAIGKLIEGAKDLMINK